MISVPHEFGANQKSRLNMMRGHTKFPTFLCTGKIGRKKGIITFLSLRRFRVHNVRSRFLVIMCSKWSIMRLVKNSAERALPQFGHKKLQVSTRSYLQNACLKLISILDSVNKQTELKSFRLALEDKKILNVFMCNEALFLFNKLNCRI